MLVPGINTCKRGRERSLLKAEPAIVFEFFEDFVRCCARHAAESYLNLSPMGNFGGTTRYFSRLGSRNILTEKSFSPLLPRRSRLFHSIFNQDSNVDASEITLNLCRNRIAVNDMSVIFPNMN